MAHQSAVKMSLSIPCQVKLSDEFNAENNNRGHITSRSQGRGRIETCRGEKSFLKARCHCMSSPDFGPLEDPYCRVLKHDILARLASLCNRQVTVQNKSIGKAKGCAISQTACEFNLSIGTIFFAVYRGSVMQVHSSIRS